MGVDHAEFIYDAKIQLDMPITSYLKGLVWEPGKSTYLVLAEITRMASHCYGLHIGI